MNDDAAYERASWMADDDTEHLDECECNGGPPCDCPDCDHPDCSFKPQTLDAVTRWLKATIAKNRRLFVLLNDGETFTNIEGCMIVRTPADWNGDSLREAIENGMAVARPILDLMDDRDQWQWEAGGE